VVLGNPICFAGYTVVLRRFFSRRIQGEEQLLVAFFGEEYLEYRKRTWVGIPSIR
jgi:protein-S-isoprenylcysteine O-methyltransferase